MITGISKNTPEVLKNNKHLYEMFTPKTSRIKVRKISEKENEIENLNPEDIDIIDKKMHGNGSGEGI